MSASNEITREQALATIDKEMHKAPKFRNNSNIAAAHDRYCETPTPYWHDSSKDGKLSYANVCWKAQGKKITTFNGMSMLDERAQEMKDKWTRLGKALPDEEGEDDHDDASISPEVTKDHIHEEWDLVGDGSVPEWIDTATVTESGVDTALETLINAGAFANTIIKTTEEAFVREGPFAFFDLPFEIRELVLVELIGHPTICVYLRGNFYSTPTYIPMVKQITAYGNHQLRVEGLLLTLKKATWEIHSFVGNQKFQAWLEELDFTDAKGSSIITGFEAVHDLAFPYFSRFPYYNLPTTTPNSDIDFMHRCKNLRTVFIDWAWTVLGSVGNNTLDKMRKNFRLDGILNHITLETLKIRAPSTNRYFYLAFEMGLWFRQEFHAKERGVTIKLNGSVIKSDSVLGDFQRQDEGQW